MNTEDLNSNELGDVLSQTTTDVQQYEVTDSQLSDTASIQYEFLSNGESIFVL